MVSNTVEFGMTYVTGHDRSQLLLLPEAVDDYVGSDNPVRFIDAFVDGLDLAAAGFGRVAPKVTGRPAYAPAWPLVFSIAMSVGNASVYRPIKKSGQALI